MTMTVETFFHDTTLMVNYFPNSWMVFRTDRNALKWSKLMEVVPLLWLTRKDNV